MTDTPPKPAEARLNEVKYIWPIVQTIVIACMGWVAVSLQDNTKATTALTERVEAMQRDINRLEVTAKGAYPATQAEREFDRVERDFSDLRDRVRIVEQKTPR